MYMIRLTNFPVVVLVVSFLLLWLAGSIGTSFRKKKHLSDDAVGADAGLVLGATLTILGLIIGFTFSMAISRYEQRKNYEEAEANAIGTEYVRADLLPAADAQKVRALLANYTDLRILFYQDQRWAKAKPRKCRYRSTANGIVGRGREVRQHAANTHYCTRRFRHERCVEFSGIHTGRLVEPYPTFSVDPHVYDRYLLQPADRLLHSPYRYGIYCISGSDPGGVDLVLSYSRHRQPARRHHSGGAAKSCEPLSVAPSAVASRLMCLPAAFPKLWAIFRVFRKTTTVRHPRCKRFTRLC